MWMSFSLTFSVAIGFVVYRYFHGGEATGEVIAVDHGRSVLYTVKLVTQTGEPCRAILISNSDNLAVGDNVLVHYDQGCLNLARPGDQNWIGFVVANLAMLGVGGVGMYTAWFRTDPDGRIQ